MAAPVQSISKINLLIWTKEDTLPKYPIETNTLSKQLSTIKKYSLNQYRKASIHKGFPKFFYKNLSRKGYLTGHTIESFNHSIDRLSKN